MTFGRPYKERVTQEQAMIELQKQAGIQFDPKLIDIFIRMEEGEHASSQEPVGR